MRMRVATFAALLAASSGAWADITLVERIEGVPKATVPGEMTMRIKGDKMRMDMPPSVSTILDLATGDIVTLLHLRKVALRVKAPPAAGESDAAGPGAAGAADGEILKSTGRKQRISGFDCEEYTTTIRGRPAIYWIAPEFPNHAAVLRQVQSLQRTVFGKMGQKMRLFDASRFKGYPIRSEVVASDTVRIVNTVVSISEEPLDDSIFVPPADYKKVALSGMPGPKPTVDPRSNPAPGASQR